MKHWITSFQLLTNFPTITAMERIGKVELRQRGEPALCLQTAPSRPSSIAGGQRPAIPPERDQAKWPSGFPAKSRDQPRIQSGHRTVALPPEVIPLWSAIRKSGLPVFR
jgi:hypothetical protein